MKINTDKTQSNVCKEEVLMCIFKDVATHNPEEEKRPEDCWLMGSQCDVLVGKQSTLAEKDSTSKTSEEKNIITEKVAESKSEFELWSSTHPSEDQLPVATKLSQTQRKLIKFTKGCTLLMNTIISSDSLKPIVNFNTTKKYNNPEDLCDDCRWLVKAAQSLSYLESSEDDEDDDDEEEDLDVTKVLKILDQVQSTLLECCILLNTQKLHRKVREDAQDTPNDIDMLLDESDDLYYSKSTIRLSQDLGRLVTRYLKINTTSSLEDVI